MSWLLSPSSATKITPKARRMRATGSVRFSSRGGSTPGRSRDLPSTRRAAAGVEGLARLAEAFGTGPGGQRVDPDVEGYSPSPDTLPAPARLPSGGSGPAATFAGGEGAPAREL